MRRAAEDSLTTSEHVCDLWLLTCGNASQHLIVVHLLVVCEVGDGECRGQVIQERKPHPMVEV
jgi:hypothetical protein